jgi:predicted nucleic acid-binding protein
MILVDTSVWVDHLQRGNRGLAERLPDGLVCTHPYVVGELALGNLKQQATMLEAVQHLPDLAVATDLEVLAFIDAHTLHGTSVGYVDVHLLSAVLLTAGSML